MEVETVAILAPAQMSIAPHFPVSALTASPFRRVVEPEASYQRVHHVAPVRADCYSSVSICRYRMFDIG